MSEINLQFVHSGALGYGRYGVMLARELQRAGVDVYDHLPGPDPDPRDADAKVCNVVCWVSVPGHAKGWWRGQKAVVSTMWEATDLPEAFRESLHEFDTIVVPSLHNVELFGRYHPKVRYVPLGVDPDDWHYVPRTPPTSEFRFLIGGSGPRKGTDVAWRAFRKAFPNDSWGDGPVPYLVMKNPRGESFHGDRVQIIAGRISPEEEVGLYETAHCYLQPSRGEGFGLQPLQAIAQGIPTILTNAHGHEAFAHLGIGLGWTHSKADYFIHGDAGQWWEPNLDELVDAMRWVYENYDTAAACAAKSAQTVADEFTWAHTAQAFIEAVGRDDLEQPYSGPKVWHAPQAKRYRMVTNTDRVCDIAGITYHFQAGVESWELADVKRIAFEAGWLDPVCIGGDDGLTPEQVRRIPSYTAAHSFCPTCHQPLNVSKPYVDESVAS